MKNLIKLSIFAASAMAVSGTAISQEPNSVIEIEQVQLDDVWSDMQVEIPDYAWEATSTSSAVGNAAAGLVTSGGVDIDVEQRLEGNVAATNQILGGSTGLTVGQTTAYGNSATGGTWSGDTVYRAEQISNGDVAADTRVDIQNTGTIATGTTAIANVSVPTDEYGTNSAFQTQESNGSVRATTDADLCCDGYSASFATTAGANAMSSTGSTSTNVNGAVQTSAAGETVSASGDVYMGYGHNVLAATTAFGNSASQQNEWGYATLGQEGGEVQQDNGSAIDAQTYVTLDQWTGYATASAYGVGNTASTSNVGSDTGLYANQNNTGSVYSEASLTGTAPDNGSGIVTSTSIGNAATATLCNICGEAAVYGQTTQVNAGSIIARGTATVGQTGSVFGAATAVGNSATYQSNGD